MEAESPEIGREPVPNAPRAATRPAGAVAPTGPGDSKQGNRKQGDAGVRSVQRAFALLDCLNSTRPRATLTEFVQISGLATTTVKRMLDTLEHEQILRRGTDGQYTQGARLIGIAVAALHGTDLYDSVQVNLERLSRASEESANFAIMGEDGSVLFLRQSLSPRAVRHNGWIGRPLPRGRTAAGQALLGQVGADGAVSTRKTLDPDVTAVAAPIYGPGDDTDGPATVGAISITGPTFRISDERLATFRHLVATEARELTIRMGGHWPHGAQEASEEGCEDA